VADGTAAGVVLAADGELAAVEAPTPDGAPAAGIAPAGGNEAVKTAPLAADPLGVAAAGVAAAVGVAATAGVAATVADGVGLTVGLRGAAGATGAATGANCGCAACGSGAGPAVDSWPTFDSEEEHPPPSPASRNDATSKETGKRWSSDIGVAAQRV
jgi:hypothetical protein